MYTFLSIVAFFIIVIIINAIIVSSKKARFAQEGKSSHESQELASSELKPFLIIEFLALFLVIIIVNSKDDDDYNYESSQNEIEIPIATGVDENIEMPSDIEIESEKTTYFKENVNPCPISEDFIKEDLRNPETADFSMFDCTHKINELGYHRVLRSVKAKNSFGVEKKLIYEVVLQYNGGNEYDYNSWSLISIRFEEMKR